MVECNVPKDDVLIHCPMSKNSTLPWKAPAQVHLHSLDGGCRTAIVDVV